MLAGVDELFHEQLVRIRRVREEHGHLDGSRGKHERQDLCDQLDPGRRLPGHLHRDRARVVVRPGIFGNLQGQPDPQRGALGSRDGLPLLQQERLPPEGLGLVIHRHADVPHEPHVDAVRRDDLTPDGAQVANVDLHVFQRGDRVQNERRRFVLAAGAEQLQRGYPLAGQRHRLGPNHGQRIGRRNEKAALALLRGDRRFGEEPYGLAHFCPAGRQRRLLRTVAAPRPELRGGAARRPPPAAENVAASTRATVLCSISRTPCRLSGFCFSRSRSWPSPHRTRRNGAAMSVNRRPREVKPRDAACVAGFSGNLSLLLCATTNLRSVPGRGIAEKPSTACGR